MGVGLSRIGRAPAIGGVVERRVIPAVPKPLLPAGSKVMLLGDSFVTANQFTAPVRPGPITSLNSSKGGTAPWLRQMDQRFNTDTWADVATPYKEPIQNNDVSGACNGFSGSTLQELSTGAGKLDYFIARGPKIVLLRLGTNDISNTSGSLAAMQGWFNDIYSRLTAAGIVVVAETIWPRVASGGVNPLPDGDARIQRLVDYNAWLRGLQRPDLYVSDVNAVMGEARPNQPYWLVVDGLHPSDRGAYESAKCALPILRSLVATGFHAPLDPDPTVGNLLPLAAMAGTGGTFAGVAPLPTGQAPTGYVVQNNAGGSTCVVSKFATGQSGYEGVQLDITPVADGTAVHSIGLGRTSAGNVTLTSLGLAPGDWIQYRQMLSVSASDGWRSHNANALAVGSSSATTMQCNADIPYNANTYDQPADARTGVVATEPMQIPADATHLRFGSGANVNLRFRSNVGGALTARVWHPILRKVTDPRAAWMLPTS